MEPDDAKAVIENILFVADSPLPTAKIVTVFGGEMTAEEVTSVLGDLAEEYEERSLRIVEVAEGWRMQTRPEYAPWIATFFKMEKGQKLSRASLEVLAIVAYRQPITRTEMEEIRGVDCGGVLRGLIDKGLVKTMGRRRAPGKPMMYGTTSKFLEFFGLARLSDLPTLDEFRAELGDAIEKLEAAQANAEQAQPGLPFDTDDTADDEIAEDESADSENIDEHQAEEGGSEYLTEDDESPLEDQPSEGGTDEEHIHVEDATEDAVEENVEDDTVTEQVSLNESKVENDQDPR
ncbi:MAG: SMC-Scp complex subunit ScpB [Nitrospinota bacterium]|nr:SMC-Scp complex subunit ScpB [Nitrospinota bacterium]